MAHLLSILVDQLLEHMAFGSEVYLLHVSSDNVFNFLCVLAEAQRGLRLLQLLYRGSYAKDNSC